MEIESRALALLGYHKIGKPAPDGWDTWFYVPEDRLLGHLDHLEREAWRILGVRELLAGLLDPGRLPSRAAVLTFDDAYRSFLDIAFRILRQRRLPAILFAPTDFIGATNAFDQGTEPREAMCTWDDLRWIQAQGVSIQSHGAAHRRFSEMTLPEIEDDMLRSRMAIESKLGRPVRLLAYPYGDAGTDARESERILRRCGYLASCLYGGGVNRLLAHSPHRLKRIAIGADTELAAELDSDGFG